MDFWLIGLIVVAVVLLYGLLLLVGVVLGIGSVLTQMYGAERSGRLEMPRPPHGRVIEFPTTNRQQRRRQQARSGRR